MSLESKDEAEVAKAEECTQIPGTNNRLIQFCNGRTMRIKRYSRYPSNQEWYYVPWDKTSIKYRPHLSDKLGYKECYKRVFGAPTRIPNLDYHPPPEEDEEEEENEEEEEKKKEEDHSEKEAPAPIPE